MVLSTALISGFLGLITGFTYGLSFIAQREGALFSYASNHDEKKLYLKSSFFSLARIATLLIFLYYLLPLVTINFIIVMITFFISFWLVVLKRGKIL